MHVRLTAGLATLLLASGLAAAAEELELRTTGYFMWDIGFVDETQDSEGKTWQNEFIGGLLGGLRLTANPSERLYLIINPEFQGTYMLPRVPGTELGEGAQKLKWTSYMEEAKTVYTLGDLQNPSMKVGMGYMVYKENPDARIFGDYLFRSMIYPSVLFTKFNYPQTNIFGLHLENNLGKNFSHNLFALGETEHYPFFDLSLAYTAQYSLNNLVEVGAGVNFRSVVPIRPSLTTPKGGEGEGVADNTYKTVPFVNEVAVQAVDGTGNPITRYIRVVKVAGQDSALVYTATTPFDTANLPPPQKVRATGAGISGLTGGPLDNAGLGVMTPDGGRGELYPELVTAGGTNTQYSFKGTILTGRLAINPLGFMETNPLGRNALKVYGEIAVLGWKNYPGFYEDRSQRMPRMFGINLPTFDYLDFLTAEVEYFPNLQLPGFELRYRRNVPQPGVNKAGGLLALENAERQKEDDWKWGLAAKKSFRGIMFVAQAGQDHSKWRDKNDRAVMDNLTRPAHWYMQLRVIGGVY